MGRKTFRCTKENRSIRKKDETKKKHEKGTNRPTEGVRIVLERQKDIEAQFWAAYCRHVWVKIRTICQEACYRCSHLKTDERHHSTCQMSDEECIRRFIEMALGDVGCLELVREWYDGLNPPLSVNEMMFDTPWVLQQMERPDRITILRELMIGPSMSDEVLLETVPSMSDEELLEAVEGIEGQPDDTNMLQFGGGEFLDPVEEEEENKTTTVMEEKENGAFIRVNPDCWGCCHFLPSQVDHACCNYGQQEEEPEEEQETMTDATMQEC